MQKAKKKTQTKIYLDLAQGHKCGALGEYQILYSVIIDLCALRINQNTCKAQKDEKKTRQYLDQALGHKFGAPGVDQTL